MKSFYWLCQTSTFVDVLILRYLQGIFELGKGENIPKKIIATYLHLVWATWDREFWITSEIERQVYRIIVGQVHKLGCKTIAINGMPDHIHILLKFPTTVTIAELVKNTKGVSSRYINQTLITDDHFKWQIGYGAFTVSRWDTDRLKNYIGRQKQHHNEGNLIWELEEIKISVPEEGRSAKLD